MESIITVSGIILAGGLSTRIGRDKGGLTLGKAPLAQRVLEMMAALFAELIYVTNEPLAAPAYPRIKLAKDDIPHLGPLGGILAGLKVSSAPRAFVIGYDMPFVRPELVHFLIGCDVSADIVVPRAGGRFEPLHAVYSRSCIQPIAGQLAAGDNRIIGFYDQVSVTVIEEPDLKKIDPDLRSFFNVNTWEDLKRAEALMAENSG